MKNLIFVLALLIGFSFTANSQSVSSFTVGENSTAEIDNPNYGDHHYKLKNKSLKTCSIKVLDRDNREFISGFGMGKLTTAMINVPANGIVLIENESKGNLKIKAERVEKRTSTNKTVIKSVNNSKETKATVIQENDDKGEVYITFNLINNSAKDIPLLIPSVMNPNLLPFSKSGVSLKVGQKIYFKAYGKKYELLTVSKEIAEGEDLIVSRLLKERKYELGFY